MQGDFSRDTFDPSKHYSRVLMQQGRVQLDADWNEQAALMLSQLRALARDLIGPAWAVGDGFRLTLDGDDIRIGPGRFYVDGIACEAPAAVSWRAQSGVSAAQRDWDSTRSYLVYLDAWERLLTAAEDGAIREVALGGADTAARAQVVWQVRLLALPPATAGGGAAGAAGAAADGAPLDCSAARAQLKELTERSLPQLLAFARDDGADTPCEIAPDAAYRGPENQLYRVEVHDPGAVDASAAGAAAPSFKWSRDNGAVVFPVLESSAGNGVLTVTLAHLGRDERSSLTEGDWVELVDDPYLYQQLHESLLRVTKVDRQALTVTLAGSVLNGTQAAAGRILRRWDQRKDVSSRGVIPIKEHSTTAPHSFVLEDGVSIRFAVGAHYRTGDYWLIPARTATGDVEWPTSEIGGQRQAQLQGPHGVIHHLGLLGTLAFRDRVWQVSDCRCTVAAGGLASCP